LGVLPVRLWNHKITLALRAIDGDVAGVMIKAREVLSETHWRDFPNRRSDGTGFRVLRDLPSV